MIVPHAIENLADEIARLFKPQQIILFGSYASGTPNQDSDVDLLIVMPYRGPDYRAASKVRLAIDFAFPTDIIVRSPAQLKKRLAMNDVFMLDIVQQGLVLHDCHDTRMCEQGRRRLRRRLHSAAFAQTQPV